MELISCGSLGPSTSSLASGVGGGTGGRALLNTSFGSHKSSSSSTAAAAAAHAHAQQHRKSHLNLSFSGSERETGGALLEDDVFPPPPQPPLSPRTRRKSQHLR